MKATDQLTPQWLNERYATWGHFYTLAASDRLLPCRSRVEILATGRGLGECLVEGRPDALVVMMNPGGCAPTDTACQPRTRSLRYIGWPGDDHEFVAARPDPTLYQLMRLMAGRGWTHLRVINLSDLRSGNCGEFFERSRAVAERQADRPDSLFSPSRYRELCEATHLENPVVIPAWGRLPGEMRGLAQSALDYFNGCSLAGIPFADDPVSYRHPNPRVPAARRVWLAEVEARLEQVQAG